MESKERLESIGEILEEDVVTEGNITGNGQLHHQSSKFFGFWTGRLFSMKIYEINFCWVRVGLGRGCRVFTVDLNHWLKSWLSVKGRGSLRTLCGCQVQLSNELANKENDQCGPINLINRWDNHLPWLLCHQLQVVSWLMKLSNPSQSMDFQQFQRRSGEESEAKLWQQSDRSDAKGGARKEVTMRIVGFFIGGLVVMILIIILIILGCHLGVYSCKGLMGKGDRQAS